MMYIRTNQLLKAVILLLFAVFLFLLHETGEIARFINPQYVHLSQIASILFLFLFFIQVPRMFTNSEEDLCGCGLWGCSHGEEGRFAMKHVISYGLISLPLMIGFLFPFKDFGAAEALKRGVQYQVSQREARDEASLEKNVQELLEQSALVLHRDNFVSSLRALMAYPTRFVGKPILLEGFIIEDCQDEKVTVITRFLVTHCVADSHAAGFILEHEDSLGGREEQWLQVMGVLDVKQHGGVLLPVIRVIEWEEIEPPANPYVYP
ncbi:TIGR03943 family protein [Halalkalibacterium halodurans]|uniref:TIGR03943 family putative permease subunit n=1 Tax=Halalkalibacterium halodurans TaxID=86665 RepID=UPI002E24D5E2|nr:TIGR03943 family protein [Halalkalibacterium halodurans]